MTCPTRSLHGWQPQLVSKYSFPHSTWWRDVISVQSRELTYSVLYHWSKSSHALHIHLGNSDQRIKNSCLKSSNVWSAAKLLHTWSKNGLLPELQSAYRRSHSTETANLKMVTDFLLATDGGEVTLLSLLDLSAAFDTVDHDILINRLYHSFGLVTTRSRGSRVSSPVVHRESELETSTLCTPKSTTLSHKAVYLGQSCSSPSLR